MKLKEKFFPIFYSPQTYKVHTYTQSTFWEKYFFGNVFDFQHNLIRYTAVSKVDRSKVNSASSLSCVY